ncbi:MAG: acyl-ACP--UDP-N-acetylglucosamine O-acyltransferase [Planctomycetes bacterium]|nr:acyl-ACP--UDP-N-acetylglucosamine O-acyltransferase [Planctomycetota bacterium]
MPFIHPTAVVDRNARLADDVQVGPYTVIGPKVTIHAGTSLGSHCVIEGRTTIGSHNRIGHHVCLGNNPQDLKFRGEDATLDIGDCNDIRENVTAHTGTRNGGNRTAIGSHNFIMVGAHIAHDCIIGDHTILSNNVMLAGHIVVEDHAVIAGGAGVSHYVTIGRYAFIGGLSGVVRDCPPFMCTDGHPAAVRGVNTIGLTRHKFEPDTIDHLKRCFLLLWGRKARDKNGNIGAALEEAEATFGADAAVQELVQFTRHLVSAPNGRHAETLRADDKRRTPTR